MALACCGCAESCARAETAWLGLGAGLGLRIGFGFGLGFGLGELRVGRDLQLLVLLPRLQLVRQHHEAWLGLGLGLRLGLGLGC